MGTIVQVTFTLSGKDSDLEMTMLGWLQESDPESGSICVMTQYSSVESIKTLYYIPTKRVVNIKIV